VFNGRELETTAVGCWLPTQHVGLQHVHRRPTQHNKFDVLSEFTFATDFLRRLISHSHHRLQTATHLLYLTVICVLPCPAHLHCLRENLPQLVFCFSRNISLSIPSNDAPFSLSRLEIAVRRIVLLLATVEQLMP
jgi:hypothetical protein